MSIVYLNGRFLEAKDAKISIFDRGFLFGDAVYEVIPIYCNHFIGFKQHIDRLEKSLHAIQMSNPLSKDAWKSIFLELLRQNKFVNEDICIYLQITRGAPEDRAHTIPTNIQPTVLALCYVSPKKPMNIIAQGCTAVTQEDKRRTDCFIKSTSLLPNILAHQTATDHNVDECILIRNGYALEGASSNLFIVKNKALITPPLQPKILPGITRQIILQIASINQIPYVEAKISENELLLADEVWLTGSTKEIYPIIKINRHKIGSGKVGPLWQRMIALYQQFKKTGNIKSLTDKGAS